ncbi:MAG: hypothetical protein OEX08_00885 [Candidatus Nomurabacteria bacterium]|nr:hypothetical protein [Candidatus Nomurabacteria bacterium]
MLGRIPYRVSVRRGRTPEEAINATAMSKDVDWGVVKTIPKGEGREVDVFFFSIEQSKCDNNYSISVDALEQEYEKRGLKPDPFALMAVNEDDYYFSSRNPNTTYWRDEDGNGCFITFYCFFEGHYVKVGNTSRLVVNLMTFAGVPK